MSLVDFLLINFGKTVTLPATSMRPALWMKAEEI